MEIEKTTAKMLYPEAPEWFKNKLVEEFGTDLFKEQKYEQIKTFADACMACGTTEEEFNRRWSELGLPSDTLFYEKLKIIAKAVNNNWEPDWSNGDQPKYWPYFDLSSGFRFNGSGYGYSSPGAGGGSRLCFETREQSDYAGKQFLELYKGFMIIQ